MALAITAVAFLTAEARAATSEMSIRWVTNAADARKIVVEVHGLARKALDQVRSRKSEAEWQGLLSVFAGQGSIQADLTAPPMLGDYRVTGRVLRFEPRYPLERGVTYRAVLRTRGLLSSGGEAVISSSYVIPGEARSPATKVAAIFPSADVLPENLLKFYVHFTAPMSRGHIYDHIQLLDAAGKAVELPFLEIDEELWDPAMTRLTLFIDPGRIKRGVKPLEEIGPALEEGETFTLVIDSAWQDAMGSPLVAKFAKPFRVGPQDRMPPDPTLWKIQAPPAGTSDPLVVEFTESLDHALAQRMLRVVDAQENLIEGRTLLEDQERRWKFEPAAKWQAGLKSLVVQTTIEDLAGNNIGKPFEVDLFDNVQRRLASESVKLVFEVR